MTPPSAPFALAPRGYGAVDRRTEQIHTFQSLAAQLPWRDNSLAPHEPRMPPHQYVVVNNLSPGEQDVCRMLEFVIDNHSESYLAYFRGYMTPTRYLEVDGLRYWRSRTRVWFVNRARLDSVEPPRRVDEGAKPIPPEQWGAKYPYWPQGSGYGEWKRQQGRWVFHEEEPPGE